MRFVSCALFVALALGSAALGSTITYIGNGTSSGGNTVDASAVFTTGAGTVTITLNNLLSNPTDVAQNISDLVFTLSNGATSGTLTSSSGTALTVNSGGSYTVGSTVSTGWDLTSMGSSLVLNVLGTAVGPAHTIIGTSSNGTYVGGTYSSANGSIAGNGPHNPFLESATSFTISVPSVTASTTITAATFSFGTTAGNTLSGTPGSSVPEPTTFALLGAGLLALGASRRRRSAAR